jgi:Tol biopolymer transport system component
MTSQTDALNAALAGRYHIERHLGEGGMASVYLCADLKHGRNVALKLLKPELAAVLGADRFVQEIKTTAALQHPHILPLFDSGTADGFLFYVMPYIQGETLREKLNRETQLGVDEAVRIAREVADALDYAHRHGVIHRDIKPENILLHDGRPMVADFGIALAVSAAAGGRMTETGLSLGTPHYMSPEQATAEREITARSDIYSIGSVLYEMLTGNPPFTGATAQQIIMKIITAPAEPVTQYRKSVPPNVAAAVARSLEKLPADRFESAKAFADALSNPTFHGMTAATVAAPVAASRRRALLVPAVGAGAAALGFFVAAALRPAEHNTRASARFVVSAAPSAPPVSLVNSTDVAISPDGRLVAYLAVRQAIYVRPVDALAGTMLAGTEGTTTLAFSPDGKWIAYYRQGALRKIPSAGGPEVTLSLAENLPVSTGLSWGSNDTIAVGTYTNMLGVPADGGAPAPLTKRSLTARDSVVFRRFPEWLPGNRALVFTSQDERGAFRLAVLDRKTGEERTLEQIGSSPRWSPTGHIIYAAGNTLWALPFDAEGLRPTGLPLPVLEGIALKVSGAASFSVARDEGALVYASASATDRSVVWIDAVGRVTPVEGISPGIYRDPRFSPDGSKLALASSSHVLLYDIRRATLTQLTRDSINNYAPVWTPDGQNIVYTTTRSRARQLYMRRADGSGNDTPLFKAEGDAIDLRATTIVRDGSLLVTTVPATIRCAISVVAMNGGRPGEPKDFARNTLCNDYGELSPDQRWLAYGAGPVVVVERYPEGGMRQQLSDGPGRSPVWSRDGKTLYYIASDSMMAVPIRSTTPLTADRPRLLFRAAFPLVAGGQRMFDVGPDGRFAAVLTGLSEGVSGAVSARPVPGSIILIQDWTSELRRLFARK